MAWIADNLLFLLPFFLPQFLSFDNMMQRVIVIFKELGTTMLNLAEDLNILENEIEQTLSVEKDRYLDAHRFGNTPYFPFVMGIEYFLRQFRKNHSAVMISDYSVESPLIFRRDRERIVKISKKKMQSNCYQFKLGDLSEVTYIQGKVEQRKSLRKNDRTEIEVAQDFLHRFDQTLYTEVLPHGPHFHNTFDIVSINESEVSAKQYGFLNDLFYIDTLKSADLAINPAMLDGLLQLCAIHSIRYSKRFILPTGVKHCFINLSLMKTADCAYVLCKKIDDLTYDLVVANSKGQIFVEMKGMRFSPLARSVPDLHLGE